VTAIRPIQSDHSGEWHMEKFAEFAALKTAVGEPTPHMRLVMWLSENAGESERWWRAGCYLAGYSVLTAEAIWREWPWDRVRDEGDVDLLPWLRSNWPGVHTRTPRRMVRSPSRMTECLLGYRDWLSHYWPPWQTRILAANPRAEYEAWWDRAMDIPSFGRYAVIRLLELYRRWGWMKAELFDIRAIGAHSPIRCLVLLRPDRATDLYTGNSAVVDALAEEVRVATDPALNHFAYAALLCEYRSSYEDRKDYPGHQTDEELGYMTSRYMEWWQRRGFDSNLWKARAATSPAWSLGEYNGWSGVRREAGRALREFGVNWSDQRFDYAETLTNGGRPT